MLKVGDPFLEKTHTRWNPADLSHPNKQRARRSKSERSARNFQGSSFSRGRDRPMYLGRFGLGSLR